MKKICINIVSTILITLVSELVLDYFFRKKKARLKLENFRHEKKNTI